MEERTIIVEVLFSELMPWKFIVAGSFSSSRKATETDVRKGKGTTARVILYTNYYRGRKTVKK